MNGLFTFLAGAAGRLVRIVAGIILIVIGVWVLSGVWRWVLIVIGFVPFLAGLFDFCVFAPLFGLPFIGDRLRRRLSGEENKPM